MRARASAMPQHQLLLLRFLTCLPACRRNPLPPPLPLRPLLQALLDLLLGRLRARWQVADNASLTVRLAVLARSLQA